MWSIMRPTRLGELHQCIVRVAMTERRIAAFLLLSFMILLAGCTAYKLCIRQVREAEDRIFWILYQAVTDRHAEVDFILLRKTRTRGIKGVSADYELYIDDSRFAAGKASTLNCPWEGDHRQVPVVVVYKELLNAVGR